LRLSRSYRVLHQCHQPFGVVTGLPLTPAVARISGYRICDLACPDGSRGQQRGRYSVRGFGGPLKVDPAAHLLGRDDAMAPFHAQGG
jgi:hypothetical protein